MGLIINEVNGDTVVEQTPSHSTHINTPVETIEVRYKDTERVVVSSSANYAPAGPPGPAGVPGPQGPVGEVGPAGTTDWDGITDKPTEFPPGEHSHDYVRTVNKVAPDETGDVTVEAGSGGSPTEIILTAAQVTTYQPGWYAPRGMQADGGLKKNGCWMAPYNASAGIGIVETMVNALSPNLHLRVGIAGALPGSLVPSYWLWQSGSLSAVSGRNHVVISPGVEIVEPKIIWFAIQVENWVSGEVSRLIILNNGVSPYWPKDVNALGGWISGYAAMPGHYYTPAGSGALPDLSSSTLTPTSEFARAGIKAEVL